MAAKQRQALGADSWKDLVADKPIVYSPSQLQKLREENKVKWRYYLNTLFSSKHWQKIWSFEGSEDWHCAPFEPHHYKEGNNHHISITFNNTSIH